MGVTQSTTLNDDTNARVTTGEYADRGDGTSKWFHWHRVANGGDAAQGGTADAAVTDPTSSGTVISVLKGVLNRLNLLAVSGATSLMKAEDSAAVSGDTGVMALAVRRDTPTADGAAGDYVPLHVDSTGRLRVGVVELTNATSTALEASRVVKASAGRLYGAAGYSTSAGFLHIYNSTSLPADGGTPVVAFPITADTPWSIEYGVNGRVFSTGIVIGLSSTGPTKTLGSASLWIDAQYE